MPYLAVSFAVYDELKAMLPASKAARLEWWYPVAKIGIGATAAVIAQACLRPSEGCNDPIIVHLHTQGVQDMRSCMQNCLGRHAHLETLTSLEVSQMRNSRRK